MIGGTAVVKRGEVLDVLLKTEQRGFADEKNVGYGKKKKKRYGWMTSKYWSELGGKWNCRQLGW